MATPKGYPSTDKEDRLSAEFTTVSHGTDNKVGLDVNDISTGHVFASDATEAASTTTNIEATAHGALKGDRIRFTSGANDTLERGIWAIVDVNNFTLDLPLPSAPAPGDTFDILRRTSVTVSSAGGLLTTPGPVRFLEDTGGGPVQVEVLDDQTAGASKPLPVKLHSAGGDIRLDINGADIDVHVQLEHDGVSPDSVQIGDGTTTAAVKPVTGELKVRDDDANIDLDTIAGDTTSIDDKLPATLGQKDKATSLAVTLASNEDAIEVVQTTANDLKTDANLQYADADVTDARPLPSKLTDGTTDVQVDLSQRLRVYDSDANSSLDNIETSTGNVDTKLPATVGQKAKTGSLAVTLASDEDELGVIQATRANLNANVSLQLQGTDVELTNGVPVVNQTGNELQVDVVAALPAGTNNIGDVDVLTEPATAADAAAGLPGVVKVVAGYDGTNVQAISTDSTGAINVAGSDYDVFTSTFTDASTSNIPGNATAPLELVASTGSAIRKIQVADTTGQFLEIMTGAAASEVRKFLVGPGSDQTIEVQIPAATRISVRRVDDAAAITLGELAINYLS